MLHIFTSVVVKIIHQQQRRHHNIQSAAKLNQVYE